MCVMYNFGLSLLLIYLLTYLLTYLLEVERDIQLSHHYLY